MQNYIGKSIKRLIVYLILCCGAFVSIFPYLWSLSTSLKPENQVFSSNWIPSPIQWSNYTHVLTTLPFGTYIFNTIFVSIVSVLGQIVFGSMAAYAFARMEFRGKNLLFGSYLSTLMVPNIVTLIPMFILMKQLGWINTYNALIAPTLLGTPVGIFLLRQFFLTIPKELEEAARIDGASIMTIFLKIILPVSRPALATLSIITFVSSWNNFMWPLIVTNSDSLRMISLAVSAFQSQHGAEWNYMMAASMIALVPLLILFFAFQKHIINSIQLSGLK
jgi:multiple sugar transport system permease protein